MDLNVRTSTIAGRSVLGITGEIDLATIPKLHDALVRALTAPSTLLIVDLDGVYSCDDTGLGVLLGAAGRARVTGGDVVVVCSAGPFRDRLARTGFDRALTVTSSAREAALTTAEGDR